MEELTDLKRKLSKARICSIDIETTLCQSMVFRTGKQNISHEQLLSQSKISTVTYKFVGDDPICLKWDAENQCDKQLMERLCEILPSCHYVVGHNFKMFDDKFIQSRALLNGLPPIPNYNIFDTYGEAKKVFNLPSLKLDYLARVMFDEQKADNGGLSSFISVTKGYLDELDRMGHYNIKDVYLTEKVFLGMLPYTKHAGNFSIVLNNNRDGCPACGSLRIGTRGYRYTARGKYVRYQCNDCGHWSQGSANMMLDKHYRADTCNFQDNAQC